MMASSLRRLLAALVLSASFFVAGAQGNSEYPVKKENPPYKVFTSGKRITIKSSKAIQHIMLWTTDGNRVAEHKQINANSFTLNLNMGQKTFFLMVGMEGGKTYTEKIGLP